VAKASSVTVIRALGILISLAVAFIPVFTGIVALMPHQELLRPERWLIAWILCYLVEKGAAAYRRGKRREAETARFDAIHASLAATVDRIAHKLVASPKRLFDIRTAETLIISLLHRIKEYAKNLLPHTDRTELRVTLAVPWDDPKLSNRRCLRVWCYDQPYASANWTSLPLPLAGEDPLPGSPSAFVKNSIQIIHDVTTIPQPNKFRGPYRSVLSLPVSSGGPGGQCLAVVNIDASERNYFNSDIVDRVVYPKLAPALNLLALVFLLIEPGATYEFGN
jgi:hypothetical protein